MAKTATTHQAITVAQEIYDRPGDLAPHQQEFLTAVHRIRGDCIRTKAASMALSGLGSKTYLATAFNADQTEADGLTKALAVYREALEHV
jgi:hypothetical protein